MMYFIYTLISTLLLPFAFMRLRRKGKVTSAYLQRWDERKGYAPFTVENSIWIHAVSLGESIAAETLIKKCLADYPDNPVVVTTMTPTGSQFIRDKFGDQVHHCYFPYDLPWYMNRLLDRIKPKILLLMETELWPNCLKLCNERKIPALLVNARLSERSYTKYAKFKSVSRQMVQHLAEIIAQTDDDKSRFVGLGADENHVHVTGSSKFDITLPTDLDDKINAIKTAIGDRPSWIGASTHEGEEGYLLDAHEALIKKHPNILLTIVPRHPERFEAVRELCEKRGFNVVTRSSGRACDSSTQIYLGDTMGEMLAQYAVADIAFVGGSFVATGGHNMLEPAAMKKPVLTGPYVFNFELIAKILIEQKAAMMVHQPAHLIVTLEKLFAKPEIRAKMGENGFAVVSKNQGAFDRQYAVVKQVLSR